MSASTASDRAFADERGTGETAGPEPAVTVVEYTDPFCSWAWSTEPKLRRLRLALGGRVAWRRVLGILFDGRELGADEIGPAVEAQLEAWDAVAEHTGAPLPARLERPVTSSRPAARAAKAAALQRPELEDRVVRRFREWLFVSGRPADEEDAIAEAVEAIRGLDIGLMLREARTDRIRAAAEEDWEETRRPNPSVIDLTGPPPHPGAAASEGARLRYRFPTILVTGPAGTMLVPGWRSYETYAAAVAAAAPEVELAHGLLPSADEALAVFETVTRVDLDLLLEHPGEPTAGVRVETRNGPVWMTPERAALLPREPARLLEEGRHV